VTQRYSLSLLIYNKYLTPREQAETWSNYQQARVFELKLKARKADFMYEQVLSNAIRIANSEGDEAKSKTYIDEIKALAERGEEILCSELEEEMRLKNYLKTMPAFSFYSTSPGPLSKG
jgi:hypothetical protein